MLTIKRYPNRKLYDTEAKQYITLDRIAEQIRQGLEVQVVDHATGEDLTAVTLTQIILEQERRQVGVLSNSFLTGLIREGGDWLASLQRNLRAPQEVIRHMDEEIRVRIQELVNAGELSDKEGRGLLEKLLRQPLPRSQLRRLDDQIQAHLAQRQLPSREDMEHLTSRLEALEHLLVEMIETPESYQ